MSLNSTIEWTDATWNPVTGCTQISEGCDHCYAKTFAERWRGIPNHPYEQGFDVRLWENRLNYPLTWKKPRRIFTNSMSDLFHKNVPDDFILRVFDVMARADWHTFQVLTKRPARLARLVPKISALFREQGYNDAVWHQHIWLGVSVETMRYHARVEHLRRVPAAVRFVSAEPLLGSLRELSLHNIDWVIAGGESGPKHRVCDAEWVRELRDNCQRDHVAFFFKQWGGRVPKSGGRTLDERTWDEYPAENAIVAGI